MKKIKKACMCQGQSSKKNINDRSDDFAIQLSPNQVCRAWKFSQSGFEGRRFQPIRV
jgi:hypothetical protein